MTDGAIGEKNNRKKYTYIFEWRSVTQQKIGNFIFYSDSFDSGVPGIPMKFITCIQSQTNLDSSCCFYLQENSETSTGDDERSGMNNIRLTVCLSSEKGLSTATGPITIS